MKLSHLAFGLGLLCLGGVASAADAPQATQTNASSTSETAQPASSEQPAAEQSDKQEKKICKREPMTGSLIGAKVCRTQKEWDEQAKGNGAEF